MKNIKMSFAALLVALTTGLLLTTTGTKAGNVQPVNTISTDLITCESEVNPNSMFFILNFHLNESSDVDIHLYDQCGNDLGSVYKGYVKAGEATINIDCTAFPKGTYICEICAGKNIQYISLQKILK